MAFEVSVFLENKITHFERITNLLKKKEINIRTLTLNSMAHGWGVLNLLVDQDGMISMSSLDAPDYVIEAIPNLEATLYEAINLIPQAEAGVKTNVGVLVTTSFTLPLRIFAQE